ncbi:MAG: DUF4975 domain-containing protein [Muribaculaceae bacterium]|nr:DUF4975 domain-containing protein [Muribaculaceae bacterium]
MNKNMILTAALLGTALIALPGCNDDDVVINNKDLDHTSQYLATEDEDSQSMYYKPYVGYCADPMPFYDPANKDFKVLYLQDYLDNQQFTYHPIWGVSTKDGVSYTSLGELISCGAANELDAALGTGSTIYKDGVYYTFYTAHSPAPDKTGGINEAVMLATSKDFSNWEKNRELIITGEGNYDTKDFRDPLVFQGEDGKYHLLIATKQNGKGVLADFISDNLLDWSDNGVFMTMMWDRFYECPDIFKMGEWWYLLYSEQADFMRKIQYFKGRTLEELKACTKDDAGIWPDYKEGILDSRGTYAGKTASDGTDRYLWGWNARRNGFTNDNSYNWGGNLVMHKIIQHEDGTISLGEVPAIANSFGNGTLMGDFSLSGEEFRLMPRLDRKNRITFTVTTSNKEWDKFGVSFARGSDSDSYYTLVFNPENEESRKINFEREGAEPLFIDGSDSYWFPTPEDGVYNITITNDNSVMTMYVNDNVAYTNRLYGMQRNCWSINSYGGNITVSNLSVSSKN